MGLLRWPPVVEVVLCSNPGAFGRFKPAQRFMTDDRGAPHHWRRLWLQAMVFTHQLLAKKDLIMMTVPPAGADEDDKPLFGVDYYANSLVARLWLGARLLLARRSVWRPTRSEAPPLVARSDVFSLCECCALMRKLIDSSICAIQRVALWLARFQFNESLSCESMSVYGSVCSCWCALL